MAQSNEAALRHVIHRVETGHLSALAAGEQIAALGFLMIGTERRLEGRRPSVPYMNGDPAFSEGRTPTQAAWRPRITTERGGVIRMVRAGSMALPVLISALGGDTNQHTPRQDLLPEGVEYDMGTHGWGYNPGSGKYHGMAHGDLLAGVRSRDPGVTIGWGDVVRPGERMIQIPGEPGHFGIRGDVETLARYPVRAIDVVSAQAQITPFYYEPMPR